MFFPSFTGNPWFYCRKQAAYGTDPCHKKRDGSKAVSQTVEKVGFQQDIALNQLPKARVTSACAVARFDKNRQTIAQASALLLFPKIK